ncbi:MAG TPA: Ig-like domain-containing protein [Geopsychrobacteraceae bacterium]|nr:Ig-like domain-containing protein [Geopsychrobacteraceae bacterium]
MRTENIIKSILAFSLISILMACGSEFDSEVNDISGGGTSQDLTAPKIIGQLPSDQSSASIDVVITISLDEEIDPSTVFDDSIQVEGATGSVSGTVTYYPSLKQLTFVPDEYLMAFSSYQVYCTGIADMSGNPVEQFQDWTFTTIFDQLPPELPIF